MTLSCNWTQVQPGKSSLCDVCLLPALLNQISLCYLYRGMSIRLWWLLRLPKCRTWCSFPSVCSLFRTPTSPRFPNAVWVSRYHWLLSLDSWWHSTLVCRLVHQNGILIYGILGQYSTWCPQYHIWWYLSIYRGICCSLSEHQVRIVKFLTRKFFLWRISH